MKTCNCYELYDKYTYTYNSITGEPIPHKVQVGVCLGTKEKDECLCKGDGCNCDFYEHVRKEAKEQRDIEHLSERLDRAIKNLCSGDENAVPELLIIKHILEKKGM